MAFAVDDILILEREPELGGILLQCIHSGFGLHRFGEELTGPEYAARYAKKVVEMGIPALLSTMVLTLHQMEDGRKEITAVSSAHGLIRIKARAVVLAMGCRERGRGALNIPGTRPAGIYTAGCCPEIRQYQGVHARDAGWLSSAGGDIGSDYGTAYDAGRCKGRGCS